MTSRTEAIVLQLSSITGPAFAKTEFGVAHTDWHPKATNVMQAQALQIDAGCSGTVSAARSAVSCIHHSRISE